MLAEAQRSGSVYRMADRCPRFQVDRRPIIRKRVVRSMHLPVSISQYHHCGRASEPAWRSPDRQARIMASHRMHSPKAWALSPAEGLEGYSPASLSFAPFGRPINRITGTEGDGEPPTGRN